MNNKDSQLTEGKNKREGESIKTVRKIALGVGAAAAAGVAAGLLIAPKSGKETRRNMKKYVANAVDTFKDAVQKNAETVKDSTVHAAHEIQNIIEDVQEKTESVIMDIKDGSHEISQDIHETAENISNELKK